MNRWTLNIGLFCCLVTNLAICLSVTSAQETQTRASKKKNTNVATPTQAFKQIQSLVIKEEWESAAKLMTKQAADETAVGVVNLALSIAEIDPPVSIPQLDDAKQAITEALEINELDKLGIDIEPAFKLRFGGPGEPEDHEEDEEVTSKSSEDNNKVILAALEKSGNRWDVVAELSDAISSSPFGIQTLNGNVVDEDIDGDKSTLKVKHAPPQGGNRGGMIHIHGPPRFLNFVKQGSTWKYAGINEKKTAQAREEFSQQMPNQGNDDF